MFKKLRHTFELIKFSHSIFALPFALSAFFVAGRGHWEWRILFWVLLCLVSARSAAMAFNRLVDARWDALNPRTKDRHIPAGLLSKKYVMTLTVLSSLAFLAAASQINSLAFVLAGPCLVLLFFYSLAKHFTHYTQLILGLCLGMAPLGASIAVLGRITIGSCILGLAVQMWVAGFDLLYALQDLDFDRRQALYSLPVKLGFLATLQLSALLHGLFLLLLALYGWRENFKVFYWIGWLGSGIFLLWQHRTIRGDPQKIDATFFTANGLLSIFFFVFVTADIYWSKP